MTDTDIDPHRLVVAAHELGHAIVWAASGFTISEIWVKGHGDGVHGWVSLANPDDHYTPEGECGYQAGLLAAGEAERRWCDQVGMAFDGSGCRDDYAKLRKRTRTKLGSQVRRSAARSEAQRLVRVHWKRIVRLAPTLAVRGSLSPSRIGI